MLNEGEVQLLKQARALIATEDSWCQGEFAINEDGVSSLVVGANAVKFCASGAVRRVLYLLDLDCSMEDLRSGEHLGRAAHDALNAKAVELYAEEFKAYMTRRLEEGEIQFSPGSSVSNMLDMKAQMDGLEISWVNDEKGHAAVLEVFDKVLADNGGLL